MGVQIDRAMIDAALEGARDTRHVVWGRGALQEVDRLFGEAFGDQPALVVADDTTYRVAGQRVFDHLRAAGRATAAPFVFPADPTLHADLSHAVELQQALAATDAIAVAVGSGTINDLTKLASYRCDRPYMVVGTAASIDGYAAWGAAITTHGVKQTFACAAPRAILADVDILAEAPAAMTASGYADLAGKITAGADWLLADALEIEPIMPDIWHMVQDPLRAMLSGPERLPAGDPAAVEHLFMGLIISGLAMQAAGSSRPASGSEHQFSHLWEMRGLTFDGQDVSHGFKVGVGSIAMTGLYEELLNFDLTALDPAAVAAEWPSLDDAEQRARQMQTNAAVRTKALEEIDAKYVPASEIADRLRQAQTRWPELRARVAEQLASGAELRRMLGAAGCPTTPAEIGLTLPQVRESYEAARQIRRRYTVLDFTHEFGLLDPFVDHLFAPDGYWHVSAQIGASSRH